MGLRIRTRFGDIRAELVVVLLLFVASGFVNTLDLQYRGYLNTFFLPVVLAGFFLGRLQAVATAGAAVTMVVWYAILHPTAFAAGATPMQKWVDIGIWGCFLILTAAALGYLYDYRQNAHAELTQAYNGVLQILSKFIDTADRYTEAHSVRVSQGATAIAREMRLSHSEVEDVRVAALLHDVGKVDVSLDVLRKAGDLTAEEWDEIQKHPEDGARMVQQVGGIMRNAVPLILYHHEKYEGTGYYRLRGEDIPLGSRIIAVADAFDAMTTHRSYSAAKSSDEAMGILRKDSGSHFDPKVVEALRKRATELPG